VEQLGLIITLCSVASVLGLVSGGAISDATRSRFGRRTPWLAGMALASATMRLVEGFASRDFALVFVARALLFFAQYIASAYLLYALQDYVGVASLPGHGPQIAAGLVNTIRTTGSIAMVVVTGWLMQRTARRKAFLQVYAGLTVAALLAPTLSATWTAMLIFAVLSGAAYGIFASVDLAIITQVLPTLRRPRHRCARGDRRRPAIDRARDRRLAHSQPRIRSAFRLRCIDDAGRWRSERSYPEPGLALWSLSPIDSIRT
jgi:Na+/melibiose symporter-like transporter